jgi:hypothetical protein
MCWILVNVMMTTPMDRSRKPIVHNTTAPLSLPELLPVHSIPERTLAQENGVQRETLVHTFLQFEYQKDISPDGSQRLDGLQFLHRTTDTHTQAFMRRIPADAHRQWIRRIGLSMQAFTLDRFQQWLLAFPDPICTLVPVDGVALHWGPDRDQNQGATYAPLTPPYDRQTIHHRLNEAGDHHTPWIRPEAFAGRLDWVNESIAAQGFPWILAPSAAKQWKNQTEEWWRLNIHLRSSVRYGMSTRFPTWDFWQTRIWNWAHNQTMPIEDLCLPIVSSKTITGSLLDVHKYLSEASYLRRKYAIRMHGSPWMALAVDRLCADVHRHRECPLHGTYQVPHDGMALHGCPPVPLDLTRDHEIPLESCVDKKMQQKDLLDQIRDTVLLRRSSLRFQTRLICFEETVARWISLLEQSTLQAC